MLKRISLTFLYLGIGVIFIYSYSSSISFYNLLIVVSVYSAVVGIFSLNKIIEGIHSSLVELAEYFIQLFVAESLFTIVYFQQQIKTAGFIEAYIVGYVISLAIVLGLGKSKSKKAKK